MIRLKQTISKNPTMKLAYRCFLRREFFETYQTGCTRVTFVSGNKNYKSNNCFSVMFSNTSNFLISWRSSCTGFLCEIFGKLTVKNSMMEFMFKNAVGRSTAKDNFLIVFWNYYRKYLER